MRILLSQITATNTTPSPSMHLHLTLTIITVMAIIKDRLPAKPDLNPSKTSLFVAFLASTDPATGKAWCPDVLAAQPHIEAVFGGNAADVMVAEVGQKDEYDHPRIETS